MNFDIFFQNDTLVDRDVCSVGFCGGVLEVGSVFCCQSFVLDVSEQGVTEGIANKQVRSCSHIAKVGIEAYSH